MSENAFTPALGRFAPTRFYDHVIALTREGLWRALVATDVAPHPDETGRARVDVRGAAAGREAGDR